ncbi:MAG: oxygen-independent coproporphyrinogen III oxidase [bacterium]
MQAIPADLITKYDAAGPRYTSYPTVPVWSAEFAADAYQQALAGLADPGDPGDPDDPDDREAAAEETVCLYLHLPFCAKRCHYCACNAVTAENRGVVDDYLDSLEQEIGLVGSALGRRPRVAQLHWGGGSPNYLTGPQIERARQLLARAFEFDAESPLSLEADPRLGTSDQADLLYAAGFRRISLGIQDFAPEVQAAIGRRQSESRIREFYTACREAGFGGINLDLVYGLPRQTADSLQRTLDSVLDLAPDRIACFSYAHVPWVRPNQKLVDDRELPEGVEKFRLFQLVVQRLTEAGYRWIGLDHFALPDDELAVAQAERKLHRNFMGYTTRPAAALIALGMSGITELPGHFAQNSADLAAYQWELAAGRLPIVRGYRLQRDDRIRQRVITHLMCNLELPFDLVQAEFGVDLEDYLAMELASLEPLVADGLLQRDPERKRRRLLVTDAGRFFLRNICMGLDAHLHGTAGSPAADTNERTPANSATRFSRTI